MGILNSKIFEAMKIPQWNRVGDVTATRHRALSQNIANASTPGYKRKYVDFDAEVKKILGKSEGLKMSNTNEGHLPGKNGSKAIKVITDKDNSKFNGINNVDIDMEMGDLAENQIIYNTTARLIASKIQGLKAAIRGRS